MSEDESASVGVTERGAVISQFEVWTRDKNVTKPKGRHVVRFCADMWVARTFPCDLGIPTVWGILRSAGVIPSRQKRNR